jgi:hypothetical protein
MGAKTWMLVYSDANPAEKLKNNPTPNRVATDELIKKLFPKEKLEIIGNGDLSYTCPPNNEIHAGCFNGVVVIAAKEFGGDYPSKLEKRFIDGAAGKHIYTHAMHSVVDWHAFSKWENGKLIRSLSLSPDSGILEDIGERLPFENNYWDGQHPAIDPEEDEEEYPFSFHPLELGEETLKAFFGYQLEGYADDNLLDPTTIPLIRYKRKSSWWKLW